MALRPGRARWVWLEAAGLALVGLALLGLFAYALLAAARADVTSCQNAVPPGSPLGAELAAVALAGFAGGRLLAAGRRWLQQAPPVRESTHVQTGPLLQGALALFLLLTAVLLGYETYALAHSAAAPPITEYVRCAAGNQPRLVGAGAFLLTLLLGNWLWYPAR